jgi:plastocyanin
MKIAVAALLVSVCFLFLAGVVNAQSPASSKSPSPTSGLVGTRFSVEGHGLPSLIVTNPFAGTGLSTFLGMLGVNAQVQAPSTKSFVIMITAQGFDSNASITVNQGDKVQITFILDQSQRSNTGPTNHHLIAIDGYGVETAEINPTHPNATVTFTASQLGTFSIYCDTPECPIHVLMVSGTLQVDPPGQTVTSTSTSSSSASTSSSTSSSSSSASTSSTSSSSASTVPEFSYTALLVVLTAGLIAVALFQRRLNNPLPV